MEQIYSRIPIDAIPWNIEFPPKEIVDLVESGNVKPCKTIDLGCGAGNYAIYLASQGFDVTGVDISPSAIKFAEENAAKKKVKCHFLVRDLTAKSEFKQTFDFAYDWEVLHHIYPQKRKKYIENVFGMLLPGGKYVSVCFSMNDTWFKGNGKYRETPLGTVLYFSSENELKRLYEPYFFIQELKTIEIIGKSGPHLVNYAVLIRKPL